MALVEQWRPFRELERVRDEFERLMDRLAEDWSAGVEPGDSRPRMECFLEDSKMTLRTELPGIEPKDIEVDVSGNRITVRAKREEKKEERKRRFIRREMHYGTFERSIELPDSVKADDIRATYRDGVLELTMPVPKELQKKEVKVQIRRDEPREHKAS